MIKTEFLMWNATEHVYPCNSLYCGKNIQIPKIQDKKFNIDIKIIILQAY